MTEEKSKTGKLDSKFWRAFLVLLAAAFVFVGPTYVVYVFQRVAAGNYVISMISGFGLFIVGLLLIWYLVRNKVIS